MNNASSLHPRIVGPAIELRLDPEPGTPFGVGDDHPVLIWTWHPEHDDCWTLHYAVFGRALTYTTYGTPGQALADADAWYSMQ